MALIISCCGATCVSAVFGRQRSRLVFVKGSSPPILYYLKRDLKLRGCSSRSVSTGVQGTLDNGTELSLGEGEDEIRAYLFKAVKNNNRARVLLLADIFGFEDSSTRLRISRGLQWIQHTNMFRGDPWTKDRPQNLFKPWRARQTSERVAKEIVTATQWMVGEFLAAGISKKLGAIGFCFGGGQVINMLANDGEAITFGGAVSFYGTRMDASASVNVKIPVLFISGDEDALCPVTELEDIWKTMGVDSRVVIFKGRGHGFAHQPRSPEEDKDAEEAFTVLRNWLSEGLLAYKLN